MIETFIEENLLKQIWGESIVNCLKLASNSDYRQFDNWYKNSNMRLDLLKRTKIQLKIIYEICNNKYFVDHVREQLSMTLRDLIRRAKQIIVSNKRRLYLCFSKNKALELIELQISEGIDKQ